MVDSNFTLRVDEQLKKAFTEAAKQHERTGAQLLREFMKEYVTRAEREREYDAWFRQKVEDGRADLAQGRTLTHEEVQARMRSRKENLKE